MNKNINSREAILCISRGIAMKEGLHMLNMRSVAKESGFAVGSIYNYFPSKDDLIIATIGSIWTEVLSESYVYDPKYNFCENVEALFSSVKKASQKHPFFFSSHSVSVSNGSRNQARTAMNQYFVVIKTGLLISINQDKAIREEVFSDAFTTENFVDFIFSNIIMLLMKQAKSCDLLLQVIRRTIY